MKKLFFAFFALAISSFAANLLSVNTNEKIDKVEVAISIDTPFDGQIEQVASEEGVALKITGINIDGQKEVALQTPIAKRVLIKKDGADGALLLIETNSPLTLSASKSNDGQTIKVKAYKAANTAAATKTENSLKSMLGSSTPDFSWRFGVVILFLTALLIVLYFVKKNQLNLKMAPPFFGGTKTKYAAKILYQSMLDQRNRLVLFEFGKAKYLVVLGSNNMLLNKFENEESEEDTKVQFDAILNESKLKLDRFLSSPERKADYRVDYRFDEYRQRAEELN